MTQYPLSRPEPLGVHPDYRRLRETCPVARVGSPYGPAWLVTRYADVAAVLTDARFSRAAAPEDDGGILLNTDPPEHDRLRKLIVAHTGTARVERLRPRAEEIAVALARRIPGEGEFISAFAEPFSHRVLSLFVGHLVGLPAQDLGPLATVVTLAPVPDRERGAAFAELCRRLGRQVDRETLAVVLNVVFGGHAAVVAALGYCLLAALDAPLPRLAGDPEGIAELVEETLRLAPPGDRTLLRRTTEPVELGGRTLPAGALVIPSIAAANRDPDRPVGRRMPRHLAFGRGAHACLGMALARMELQAALKALAEHAPDVRLPAGTGALVRTHEELSVSPLAGIPIQR
ncbi:cytochrome P450 [Planobispora rosea]|uniref:Cytochrome P450 n=1 Tax=Planobispora rosea TaxID=35762 RepID=U5Q0S1_PLARO|nr:cytochrome P450 [Planobispora rosea]AGY49583.1 PbtO [Planobispora rosea]GGS80255.1 cytochrome P450 [Planobispora rosea]GIH86034.1 cytochrome P450 [Planobispora rosea]